MLSVWRHPRCAAHSRGTAFGSRLHTLWRRSRARAPQGSHPRWKPRDTVNVATWPRVTRYPASTAERFGSADCGACGGTRGALHTPMLPHLAHVFTLCGVAAAPLVLHDAHAHRSSRGAPSTSPRGRESHATLPVRLRHSIQLMAERVAAPEVRCTQPCYRIWLTYSHCVALLPRSCCTTLTPTVAAAGHRQRRHVAASHTLPCPYV